jgi:hypothetical protein
VVVRPVVEVVAELRDLVDLVLGLDVAVLGDADVHADARAVGRGPVQAGILDRLVGAPDSDGPGARAAPCFLALLVAQRVEVAHARGRRPEVAHVEELDARHARQQVLAELRQAVAVGAGQAHAGDDDALAVSHGARPL